ncbi:Uncharacterised protein [Mycoplasmopsis maculosa]|uniref:Uncharacterized protein n=1 Tax=Mycoplasmopsis maculosa TaxID=114885 RepID=A0A449B496_9BACT|nr:hypothetical protein [Mycoplasmopsis maculosa]VEU75396.1 Uncharacterised protein [Mycoplasmopsis maculosa]
MNDKIKIKLNFPVIQKRVEFTYREIEKMENYYKFILIPLIEFKKLNKYITVNDIFKEFYNINSDVLIRKFWLLILRDMHRKNIITINFNSSESMIEDFNLLEMDIKNIDINKKIEKYVEMNKFYSLTDREMKKYFTFYIKSKFLSENYDKYFDTKNIDKAWNGYSFEGFDKNESKEIDQKISKLEYDFEKDDSKLILKKGVENSHDIKVSFFESDYAFDINNSSTIISINIRPMNIAQNYFMEDFIKSNLINELNNRKLLYDTIFPNNTFLSNFRIKDRYEKLDIKEFDIKKWMIKKSFDQNNIVEGKYNEKFLLLDKKIFDINKIKVNVKIDDNKVEENGVDFFIPTEIPESKYLELLEDIYDKKISPTDIMASALEKYLDKFLKDIKEKSNFNFELISKIWIFLSNFKTKDRFKEITQLFSNNVFLDVLNTIKTSDDLDKFMSILNNSELIFKNIISEYNINLHNLDIFNFISSWNNNMLREIFKKYVNEHHLVDLYNDNKFKETLFYHDLKNHISSDFENLNEQINSDIEASVKLNHLEKFKKKEVYKGLLAFDCLDYINEYIFKKEEEIKNSLEYIRNNLIPKAVSIRQRLEKFKKNSKTTFTESLEKIDLKLADYYKYLSNNYAHSSKKDTTTAEYILKMSDEEVMVENNKLDKISEYIKQFEVSK